MNFNLVGEILYAFFGYIYLWIRYRNGDKVSKKLKENYDDQYYVAGAQLIFSVFGVILFMLLSGFLIAVIYSIFTHPPTAY